MGATHKQQYTIWLRWKERHRNSDVTTCPVRRRVNGTQPDRLDSSLSAWCTHNACHVNLSTATPATNTTFAVTTPAQGYGIQVTTHHTHALLVVHPSHTVQRDRTILQRATQQFIRMLNSKPPRNRHHHQRTTPAIIGTSTRRRPTYAIQDYGTLTTRSCNCTLTNGHCSHGTTRMAYQIHSIREVRKKRKTSIRTITP